jgi:hypothetical protein
VSAAVPNPELKARHRAMWASGDYPSMVETFLLPLGPRLVEACGIGAGMSVLDVAAGTGSASIPAAERGARVTASDLTRPTIVARTNASSTGREAEFDDVLDRFCEEWNRGTAEQARIAWTVLTDGLYFTVAGLDSTLTLTTYGPDDIPVEEAVNSYVPPNEGAYPQTSTLSKYDCNEELGTLDVTIPFLHEVEKKFSRTTPVYKPSGS